MSKRNHPVTIVGILGFLATAGIGVGPYALEIIDAANTGVAGTELAQIDETQEISKMYDGLYAPSLVSFTDESFGRVAAFHPGAEISYAVNESRTHFVAATKLSSGGVLVIGNEDNTVKCDDYTPECIAQVTDDAELIASVPTWVTF